jgi:hypothetical protein
MQSELPEEEVPTLAAEDSADPPVASRNSTFEVVVAGGDVAASAEGEVHQSRVALSAELSDSDESVASSNIEDCLEEFVLVGRTGSRVVHKAMVSSCSIAEWHQMPEQEQGFYSRVTREVMSDSDEVLWATTKCGVKSKTLEAVAFGALSMKNKSCCSRKGCWGWLRGTCDIPCDYLGFVDNDYDRPGRCSNFCSYTHKGAEQNPEKPDESAHYCEKHAFMMTDVQALHADDDDAGVFEPADTADSEDAAGIEKSSEAKA